MDAYLARQPIFDKTKSIYAYELLFRGGMDNFMPAVDGDHASSKLLSSTFYTIGLEAITSGKKAFINFTQKLIEQKIPLVFPHEITVVEILENVLPTKEIIQAVNEIKEKGYLLALDDFVFLPELMPLIKMADIIKIDFRLTPKDEILKLLDEFKKRDIHVLFLAEKIETNEEFKDAVEMGFSYFQGYFFCKPEIIKGREISTSQITLLQIMAEVSNEKFDFTKAESLIERDINLSFKLLKYINSAYFKGKREISKIKDAILMLGADELRRFISLIAMSQLNSSKPDALIFTSAFRAKFCDLVAHHVAEGGDYGSEFFTVGMFSLIDAILDQTMGKIMEQLPLSPVIKDALIKKKGRAGDYLLLCEKYELADWSGVSDISARLGINDDKLPDIYLEACRWSSEII
ncbi:EAL and HDOD domain-containing protein [Desulforegula conservatrix]|uniref:EAL and HDOD domain-containing protein n=1 Tax=Desulforegula conservatrix TaxID=153026 RepID=UPI0003FB9D14|nr:HDOD domain-containing protein [Desulforegula conservatrix]